MSVGLAPDGAPMMPIEVQPAGWMMQPEPAMQWWGQPGMVPVPIHRNVSAPVSMSGNEVPGYPMGYMGGMAPGFSPLYTAELHQQHQFQQQQLAAAAAAGQVVYMHPGGPTMHPGVMSPGPMMAGAGYHQEFPQSPQTLQQHFHFHPAPPPPQQQQQQQQQHSEAGSQMEQQSVLQQVAAFAPAGPAPQGYLTQQVGAPGPVQMTMTPAGKQFKIVFTATMSSRIVRARHSHASLCHVNNRSNVRLSSMASVKYKPRWIIRHPVARRCTAIVCIVAFDIGSSHRHNEPAAAGTGAKLETLMVCNIDE